MSVSGRYPSLNDLGGERAEVLTMSVGGSISMMIIIILHEMIKVVAVIHSLQFEELVISQEIKSDQEEIKPFACMLTNSGKHLA